MIDYATLRIIWWALLGALLIGFAVMDGFDLGVAALVRVLGYDDDERRVLLETVEPVWEGNQVWFVLGGGAVFAAWPLVYATAFPGFTWRCSCCCSRSSCARSASAIATSLPTRAGATRGTGCSPFPGWCRR